MNAISESSNSLGAFEVLFNYVMEKGRFRSNPDELADEFLRNPLYRTLEARLDGVIALHAAKNFKAGFLAGLGGLVVLPVTLPASVLGSCFLQTRMVATMCRLTNSSWGNNEIMAQVLNALFGMGEMLKKMGVKAAEKYTLTLIKALPTPIIAKINAQIGKQLVTKGGLMKIVPVVGGLIGGGIDAASCYSVGCVAKTVLLKGAAAQPASSAA